ncbi:MAG: ABC transporter ATP-binding protein [Candidatus Nanohalobium sp.]
MIEVEGLKKSYGSVEALSSVDLKVEEGEIVGVLGPNGAGKSTLIEVLTGQTGRDAGSVSVMGVDPEESPVKLREKLGILPEREDPPSFLKAGEYLDFVADIRDESIDKEFWKDMFNLEGKMEKLTYHLSKGERQKLMIIQAFFHEPGLVFIDEPLVNLDPFIQERAKELFRQRKEDGGTVFLCTHVVSLAEEVCDRVFFLKDGKVTEVIEDPENLSEKFLDQEE